MRFIRNAVVPVLAVLLVSSCKSEYSVEGSVDSFGYEGCSMSLVEFAMDGFNVIDSCRVLHSRFQMNGPVDSVRFVMLCKDSIPVLPMYLEKGNTVIKISPTGMRVSGTRQNDLFYSFLDEKNDIDNRFDEMQQRRMQIMQSDVIDSEELQIVHDSLSTIIRECEDLITTFILSNTREQAAIGVFSMLLGQYDHMSPLVRRILDSAPDSFFKNPTVAEYTAKVGYVR